MDEKHIYEILNLAEDEVDAVSDARVVPRSSEDESEERYVTRPSKSRNRSAAKSRTSAKKKPAVTETKKKTASKKNGGCSGCRPRTDGNGCRTSDCGSECRLRQKDGRR